MEGNNIYYSSDFGYSVYGKTIGEAWINAIRCVIENGISEPDEKRGRLALQNIRLKSELQNSLDPIFDTYAKKENIDTMVDLVFNSNTMRDCDITPSFRHGSKSYKSRIQEGDMLNFVVNRLKLIPESKKAIMVFPNNEDYFQVSNNPYNDYLPCIVSIQFRLRPIENGVQKLNTIVHMRSWNIDQKGAGDLTIFSLLTMQIVDELNKNSKCVIETGSIDMFITDIHIYDNTLENAKNILFMHDINLTEK